MAKRRAEKSIPVLRVPMRFQSGTVAIWLHRSDAPYRDAAIKARHARVVPLVRGSK